MDTCLQKHQLPNICRRANSVRLRRQMVAAETEKIYFPKEWVTFDWKKYLLYYALNLPSNAEKSQCSLLFRNVNVQLSCVFSSQKTFSLSNILYASYGVNTVSIFKNYLKRSWKFNTGCRRKPFGSYFFQHIPFLNSDYSSLT